MVICLERGADLHMAQLMPLPLTVCCFGKIQIGFTFLVPANPGSPRQRAVKRLCVCAVLLKSVFIFPSAVNVALPAFASKCRAAVPLLLTAGSNCTACLSSSQSYLLPVGCSAANLQQQHANDRQADRQMYTRPLHRPCPAYYVGSAKNTDLDYS